MGKGGAHRDPPLPDDLQVVSSWLLGDGKTFMLVVYPLVSYPATYSRVNNSTKTHWVIKREGKERKD